jgi:hypothetical protein
MNRLDVKIQEFEVEEWIGGKGKAAVIYIDGIPITEHLAQFEPSIGSDSSPSRSQYGRWIGISPDDVISPSSPFLGGTDEKFADCGNRVPVCACSECGMYWCDGIWARVHFDEGSVSWTDFVANPEINPIALTSVPDLVFDIHEYRAALANLKEA